MHLKYECSTASTGINIFAGNLLFALVIGTPSGTNDVAGFFNSIRIKRVEFRGISTAVNKITTAALTWNSDNNREITCSGNTEKPFKLTTSPPMGLTRLWTSTAAQVLFRLTTDADFGEGQVDVFFDAVLFDSGNGHNTTISTGPVRGALYTPALDCTTDGTTWNAAPKYIPVGRTTIV